MKLLKTLSLLTVASTLAVSANAQAFFQAALWPDKQLVPASEDVRGIRLNIFGQNRNMTGIDVGFAHSTTGDFVGFGGVFTLFNHVGGTTTGVQWGIVNFTEGNVLGWQNGAINLSTAEVRGLQTAFVNWNDVGRADLTGLQLGFVNTAQHVNGIQVGFINNAATLTGVQLGLWNQVDSRAWNRFDPLPKVFPFINFGF